MRDRASTAARRIVSQFAETFAQMLGAGIAPLAWPALIGISLATGLMAIWPSLDRAFDPKFGGLVMSSTCALLLVLVAAVLGKWIASRSVAPDTSGTSLWFAAGSQRLQVLLLPLTLLPLYLAADSPLEKRHPFQVLGLASLAALVAGYYAWLLPVRRLAAETPRKKKRRDVAAYGMLAALVLVYSTTLSTLSILNHISFQTSRADLGYYVSIFRRSSLGDPLGCTICGGFNHLSGHFDPILVLLSPVYWLYPEAETVLALQSFLLGSTMIPLYLLARHHGLARTAALSVLVVFGLHPALHGVNLFDFHSLALLIPAATWVWWAWETERRRWFYALFAVMLLVREDAALVGIFLCAVIATSKRRGALRLGLTLAVCCAAYFAFVKGVLMTNKSGDDPIGKGYEHYYQKLVPKGTGTKGLVNSVLAKPDRVLNTALTEPKMLYWLQLLLPVCFLPVLAREGKFLLLYGLAFTLLASRQYVYSIHFHYSSVILPFLFTTTLSALERLSKLDDVLRLPEFTARRLVRAACASTLVAALACTWKFGALFGSTSFQAGLRDYQIQPTAADWKSHRTLKQVCPEIPKEASIAADSMILPHLGRCADIRRKAKRWAADFLLWEDGKGNTTKQIAAERRAKLWKEVRRFDGFVLYENTIPADQRSDREFARARSRKGYRSKKSKPLRRPSTTLEKTTSEQK